MRLEADVLPWACLVRPEQQTERLPKSVMIGSMYQCSMKQFTIIAVVNAPFLDNVWLEMSSGCFSGRLRYEDCCQGICEQNW